MKILFLTSGSGKILNLIFKRSRVLSKKIYLYGDFKKSCNEIAKKNKIQILGYFKKSFSSDSLLDICKKNKIDYIISYSFIHKLEGKLLKVYKGRIFNSHHSILPAFRGKYFINEPRSKYPSKKIFERCLEFGTNVTGNTIHLVDKYLDNGQPILQSLLVYNNNSDPIKVRHELFKQEAQCIKQFMIWLIQKRLISKKTKIIKRRKFFIKNAKYRLTLRNPFIPNLDYNSFHLF